MVKNRLKTNISKFIECYGCGVCVGICPVKIISYHENDNGFYKPYIINQDKCINCGLCLDSCAYNHSELGRTPKIDEIISYAGWSNNLNVLENSSSGGIARELSFWALNNGYEVCGAAYNPETARVDHIICNRVEDLIKLQGSKYIPSNTNDAFGSFSKDRKYIVFGTPCQIDSLRLKIKRLKIEENFILVDFFCHGVPSLKMWDKYLSRITPITGNQPEVNWRCKRFGWHNSYRIVAKGNDRLYESPTQKKNIYYNLFLGNFVLNNCCYNKCKYKQVMSSADIRLGDFWGERFSSNKTGVSAVIALTNKGLNTLKQIENNCHLEKVSSNELLSAQMPHNAKKPFIAGLVMSLIKKSCNLNIIKYALILPYRFLVLRPKNIIRRILRNG